MNNLRTVATLLFSQARHHPARLGLASLAVIAASCAVVWVVSGYDALVAEFDEHASTYMGRYDVIVVPGRAMGGTLPESLIDDFRADPAVAEVNPIIQSRVAVARSSPPSGGERIEPGTEVMGGSLPPVHGAPPLGPVLVGTSARTAPRIDRGRMVERPGLGGPHRSRGQASRRRSRRPRAGHVVDESEDLGPGGDRPRARPVAGVRRSR